jgi:hypothetical protein
MTTKLENKQLFDEKRKLYMEDKITHKDFYLWLASFIGVTKAQLPVSQDCINASQDENLNDIPLQLWDTQDYIVRLKAYNRGLPWSKSDTVCVLKALARS